MFLHQNALLLDNNDFILTKTGTLVILTPGFPPKDADSPFLATHQLFIKTLQKNFPAVNIVIISFLLPAIDGSYTWNGIKVVCINAKPSKNPVKRLISWARIWRILRQIKNENNIVGILCFWATELAFISKYFARTNGIKFQVWITGQDAKKGNRFINLMNPKPSELVAMSDFLANEFYHNYHIKPAHVIPNGIDRSVFDTMPFEKTIHLLAVGSLIPLKQYQIFLEVADLIKKQIIDLKCVICGDGPEKERLFEMSKALHLNETIDFMGEVNHSIALKMMQRSKILLHPSSYEGFSTVCLEALYAGTHVISFIKPMDHQIKNWHIVQTKEEMAAKALELLTHPNTIYESTEIYSMDTIAKNMMSLFGL